MLVDRWNSLWLTSNESFNPPSSQHSQNVINLSQPSILGVDVDLMSNFRDERSRVD